MYLSFYNSGTIETFILLILRIYMMIALYTISFCTLLQVVEKQIVNPAN